MYTGSDAASVCYNVKPVAERKKHRNLPFGTFYEIISNEKPTFYGFEYEKKKINKKMEEINR